MFKKVLSVFIIIAFILSLAGCGGKKGQVFHKTDAVNGYKPATAEGSLNFKNKKQLKKVCENEFLQLFYDEQTYNVTVFDRRSGKSYSVNPQNEEVSKGNTRLSALNLIYADTQGKTGSADSYTQSVEKGQVEVSTTQNSITFDYGIGDRSVGLEVTPSIISNERFEKLLEKADSSQERILKRRYGYVKDYDSWSRRKLTNPTAITELVELFDALGYTKEDLQIDNSENGVANTENEKLFFKVPLTFTLDGDSVVASIDLSKVEYPESNPLVYIEFLQFFGAVTADSKGYFLLPDGSGAIMPFKSVESGARNYEASVYGHDLALRYQPKSAESQDVLMPVFGANYTDGGFLAVIEDGDALADIFAYNSGSTDAYNKVYSRVNFLKTESVALGDQKGADNFNYFNFQEKSYNGNYSVRYIFLSQNACDYNAMAASYRNYLTSTGLFKAKTVEKQSPFLLETVGGILTDKSLLGFKYKGITALTEYADNIQMVNFLRNNGVGNVKLKLTAFSGEGLQNLLPDNINTIGELGGRSGLKKLISDANDKKYGVYPDFEYLTFSQSDGIITKNNYAVKSMDSKAVKIEVINNATLEKNQQITDNLYYLTAIGELDEINGNVKEYLSKHNFKGLSIADMANTVSSDYTPSAAYDRQSALNLTSGIIKGMAKDYDLILSAANVRNANSASVISEAPLWSSQYSFTEGVPFYSMVYHGLVDYTGEALNTASDTTTEFLRCIEYGASIKYTLIYRNQSKVKNSDYTWLYSADFEQNKKSAAEYYAAVNELHLKVASAQIVKHEKLADAVYLTEYSNGVKTIVNYSSNEYNCKYGRVQSKDYIIIG